MEREEHCFFIRCSKLLHSTGRDLLGHTGLGVGQRAALGFLCRNILKETNLSCTNAMKGVSEAHAGKVSN